MNNIKFPDDFNDMPIRLQSVHSDEHKKETGYCHVCSMPINDKNPKISHNNSKIHKIMSKREFILSMIKYQKLESKNTILSRTDTKNVYRLTGTEHHICSICCTILKPKINLKLHIKNPDHKSIEGLQKSGGPLYKKCSNLANILEELTSLENLFLGTSSNSQKCGKSSKKLKKSKILNSKSSSIEQKNNVKIKRIENKNNLWKNKENVLPVNFKSQHKLLFSVENDADLFLIMKFNSITVSSEETHKLHSFVLLVENAIINLKNELKYSKELFNLFKNHDSLFTEEIFTNVISSVWHLDILATEIILPLDTRFTIAILIDPVFKPSNYFFDTIYSRFSQIMKTNCYKTMTILHSNNRFCVLNDTQSKYSIEIFLASFAWPGFKPIDDEKYTSFYSRNDMRILKSIEYCCWFLELSDNSLLIIILSTLLLHMAVLKCPLNCLNFWEIIIIVVYSIKSSSTLIGLSKSFRNIFSLLSSGILLPGGDKIPNPLNIKMNMVFDLKDNDVINLTKFGLHALRLISSQKFSKLFNEK